MRYSKDKTIGSNQVWVTSNSLQDLELALEALKNNAEGLFDRISGNDDRLTVASMMAAIHYDQALRKLTRNVLFFLNEEEKWMTWCLIDNFKVLSRGKPRIAIGDLPNALEKPEITASVANPSFANGKSPAI